MVVYDPSFAFSYVIVLCFCLIGTIILSKTSLVLLLKTACLSQGVLVGQTMFLLPGTGKLKSQLHNVFVLLCV